MKYAVVTPVRDDADNLRRLGAAMLAQSIPPLQWVIVDNGSADETLEVAHELAASAAWVSILVVPGEEHPQPGAPIVRAFKAGAAALTAAPDVVVKLDADVSFDGDHFERLLAEFARRPRLGIAGGVCLEQSASGEWVATHVTGDHVRGAVRAYRRECLDAVGPLEERVGWDGVDELRAAVLGWETGTVSGVAFYHHRAVGERDLGAGRWRALGECSYYMGYRTSYLLLRALHHIRSDRRAALLVVAFFQARLRRSPRLADQEVVRYLRRQQRLRNLPRRAREKLGHVAAGPASTAPVDLG